MKFFNSIVALILRSPLHGLMSGSTLLITFTGRKSGNQYTTPVNYVQHGLRLLITSSKERIWWRNLRESAEVQIRLRGKNKVGMAQAFEAVTIVEHEMLTMLQMSKPLRKFFKIELNPDGSIMDEQQFHDALENQVMIIVTDLRRI